MIKIKRIYEAPSANDGFRILVDRLWPRGLTQQKAQVDLWLKDLAPSAELRKWFNHDPQKWTEFSSRYVRELGSRQDFLDFIRTEGMTETVTLLFAAKDEEHNEAVIIKNKIDRRVKNIIGDYKKPDQDKNDADPKKRGKII